MSTTTDADIARALAHAWRDEYASTESGWMHHHAGIWRPVPDSRTVLVAVSDWIGANVQSNDPAQINVLRSAKKAGAVLSLLAGHLSARENDFDADPYLINCPNGVIDLRTGAVREARPSDRFTRQTGAEYNPDADLSKLHRLLEAIPEDARDWAQCQFGVSLFGKQSPHARVVILKGGGWNAKTSITTAIRKSLGTYAGTFNAEAISSGGRENPMYYMAELKGVRFLVAEEMEDKMLNETVLKRITDSETTPARRPAGRPFEFALTHDLFISTNGSLRIRTFNRGTTRRFAELPFPYTFTPTPIEKNDRKQDPSIKAWFEAVPREEVLAWLVEGARRVHENPALLSDANLPRSVRAATDDWREEQHTAQEWVQSALIRDPEQFMLTSELLQSYNEFRHAHGHGSVSVTTMLGELRDTIVADLVPSGPQPIGTSKASGKRGRGVRGLRPLRVNEKAPQESEGLL